MSRRLHEHRAGADRGARQRRRDEPLRGRVHPRQQWYVGRACLRCMLPRVLLGRTMTFLRAVLYISAAEPL